MSLRLPAPFPILQPLLIVATNVCTLAIGPKHRTLQFAISVPVLFLLAAQGLYRGSDWEQGWGLRYGLECFVASNLALWVDWVALSSPYKEGWVKVGSRSKGMNEVVKKDGDAPLDPDGSVSESKIGTKKEGGDESRGFWARLWWALRLSTTNRYTGWSCEVKNVPTSVPSSYPRWKFLIRKLLRFALFFVLKDILYSYTASSPHGTWLDLYSASPVVGFEGYPFTHRLYWTWVGIILTYISLELANTACSLFAVAFFLARPEDCPRMFNDLRECYSVRQAWSVVWHQQMRRVCSAPGIRLVRDVLQLQRGSFASKYVQLFTGFAVSGFIHAGAAMLCHASREDDWAMCAFVSQAGIIFVEDHIIEFGKRLGFSDSMFWRAVGRVWVILAIGSSLQGWTGSSLGHGLWVHGRERDLFGIGPQ